MANRHVHARLAGQASCAGGGVSAKIVGVNRTQVRRRRQVWRARSATRGVAPVIATCEVAGGGGGI